MCMLFFLRRLGNHDFRREQQARDRGGVLQSQTRHLGRIQDAQFDHIAVLTRLGVVAERALALADPVQNNRGILTGIGDDLTQRLFNGASQDLDARGLIFVLADQFFDGLECADQRNAAARDHAFFDRRTGCVQRIFDAGLLFLHFDFGRRADFDHGNAAGELGNALLQFFLVVVGSRFLDLLANAVDAALDVGGLAGAVDNRGVLFFHQNLFRFAQVVQGRLLERQADLVGNDRAAREDRDVLQHGFTTIAEARRLDGGDLDDAADRVDDQRGECLAFHIFRDDQQLTAALRNGFQQGEQFANVRDLLVDQKDQRFVQLGALALLIVDEVRREVAAIELHAFDHFELVLEARTFFNRDHAFLADLRHRIRNGLADALVGVRGDRADLRNRLRILAGFGELLQLLGGRADRLVDAALQVHRVDTRRYGLQTLTDDRLRENGGGGGAIAGFVGGVGSDFLHHLRAHVLELVLQFDFLCNGDTVLGDGGSTEALVEHGVTAFGAQRDLDGIRQNIHTLEHACPSVVAEAYVFSCHLLIPLIKFDLHEVNSERRGLLAFHDGHDVFLAHHNQFVAVHLHFGPAVLAEQNLVADFDVQRANLAVL